MLYLDRFSKATNKKSTETPKAESHPVPTFEASILDFHKSQSLGSSEILNVHHKNTPVSLVESNAMSLVNFTCLFYWTPRIAHAKPCCRTCKNYFTSCQNTSNINSSVLHSVWQFKTYINTLRAREFRARVFRALLLGGGVSACSYSFLMFFPCLCCP